jgi:hypothetical protein
VDRIAAKVPKIPYTNRSHSGGKIGLRKLPARKSKNINNIQ